MRDLYAEVSAKIIAELERGAAPWVKPWSVTPGVGGRRPLLSTMREARRLARSAHR